MKWPKKGAHLKSCESADNALLQENATGGNDTRPNDLFEENGAYLNKLQAMSELQKAILMQLIPLAPRAMHSAVLREAVAPFFKGWDKKERSREFEAAVDPLVQDGLVRYFCCMIKNYAMNPRHMMIASACPDKRPMIEEERYFTIKEVAKLLGVPKKSIKRRIESKNLSAFKRLDKRGFELVIRQRELIMEIMSTIPDSNQLSLCEFEAIVIKRFQAMSSGRDRRTSLTLKLLCEEFAQLRAEIKTLNVNTAEDYSPAVSLNRERLSPRQEKELARSL
jgi:hypothetical protein